MLRLSHLKVTKYRPGLSEKAYSEIGSYKTVSVRLSMCWKHWRD